MKLKKLLANIPDIDVKGPKDIEISGLSANSKCLAPGNLFVAKKGTSDDGRRYIPEALLAGAAAILTTLYDPFLKSVTQIIAKDIHKAQALIASNFYENPSTSLLAIGITGTNGKTTCSYLVKHLLDTLKHPTGIIGTISYQAGSQTYSAPVTTPDILTNQKLLKEMALAGCHAAVMEVSSHALHQQRTQGIDFDITIFTNISQDHLDYHRDMQDYLDAKTLLFSKQSPQEKNLPHFPTCQKHAILNKDSPAYPHLAKSCRTPHISYGMQEPADLQATNIALTTQGSSFHVTYQSQTLPMNTSLAGRFNIYNLLAAIATGLALSIPLDICIATLATAHAPPGRLEKVPNKLGLQVYVDYAVTEDSLEQTLACLCEFKKKNLITVFGCGGNRDKGKRPKMAQAAEKHSDYIIVTNDNPRKEDPQEICRDILQGFSPKAHYHVELDRYQAIKAALAKAQKDDVVLIAGKGHETYQILAHQTIEFDDRKAVAKALQELSHKP